MLPHIIQNPQSHPAVVGIRSSIFEMLMEGLAQVLKLNHVHVAAGTQLRSGAGYVCRSGHLLQHNYPRNEILFAHL